AGAAEGVRRALRRAGRSRSRPGVRRGGRRARRRHRCLFDRCQARPPRLDRARGRPRLLSEIRRRPPDARCRRPGAAGQARRLDFGSRALAVAVGVPLGVAAWRWPASEATLLGAVAVLQAIPSLAMLAFLIALVGAIGVVPAVIALFLYALLPIVRNTHAGLQSVSGGMASAALSLGMTQRQALAHVQLPLAAPTLLAGVKTAAVINVGTATMAAFIGAGGFGERIVA